MGILLWDDMMDIFIINNDKQYLWDDKPIKFHGFHETYLWDDILL